MRVLWASAVWDPCPGSVWTWQPLWLRGTGRAVLAHARGVCHVELLRTVVLRVVLVIHFARPSHGQISGVLLTQAMILGVLDMSDYGLSRGKLACFPD
jgi:hypothetical protein